jgi:hypothetical protein
MPTISDLLPPHVRAWVYAILAAASSGVVIAETVYDLPSWVLIVVGVANAAGFSMARSNTPNTAT